MVNKMDDLQVLHLEDQHVADIPSDRLKKALQSKDILIEEPGDIKILGKKVYFYKVLVEDIDIWVTQINPINRVLPGGLEHEKIGF